MNISKYWVRRRPAADAESNVYAMETPSMGFWETPFRIWGNLIPAAS
jgi:hypothetical protein